MTDQSLRRADALLTELTELVETARAVPMSSSCVVPREHVLDLLDDLREVLPPEMADARQIVAQRDELVADARDEAARTLTGARQESDAQLSAARAEAADTTERATEHANTLVAQAQADAARTIEAGKAENARLVSAAGVHQAATEAAEQLRADAEAYAHDLRARSDAETIAAGRDADAYARSLRSDADGYVDRTLSEMIDVLQRAAATAERGREQLSRRSVAGAQPVAEHDAPTGELFDQLDEPPEPPA